MSDARHQDHANAIRFLAADAIQRANSGHPGLPLGAADVATVLFSRALRFDAGAPAWPDRDRFVLSAGHGSMLLYALLHLSGYEDMTLDELRRFRQLGARTAGHPEYGHAAGIETTTGPLGQGLANAVGMALAERLLNARFGDELVDHYTYTLAGDGCLMEGISHEAISLAGHLRLRKLIVLFDDNGISIDGPTALTASDDQGARFAAAGWDTWAVDGHDPEAIAAALAEARASDRPALIACSTVIGYGSPTKEGTEKAHGSPLGDAEIAGARARLGWPHPPFEVPDDVRAWWREVGRRGAAEREAWEQRLAATDPAVRAELERALAGELPAGWRDALAEYQAGLLADPPALATRASSGKVLDVLSAAIPELVGGSADLTGSVKTRARDQRPVSADDFGGRYLYYGIREHGMAAVMNGLALHGGVIPYGGTFLVFADYMRGAMRMSALMGTRVVYVLTHDSIGLGEDGPTHQPIETLASLRAMPNLDVFRPADAIETAECWALALENQRGPSGMVLSRQSLPPVRTTATTENLCARGAYLLTEGSGARQVTLLASGSEVSVALAARERLEAEGVSAAVVSVPCLERFLQQDAAYQQGVLGEGTVRVAVEAGVRQGWDRLLPPERGAFVGMTGYGASAPAEQLFEHFGITDAAVAGAARALLAEEGSA